MLKQSFSLITALLLCFSAFAQTPPFSFAGHTIPAGRKQTLNIPVSAGTDSTFIPVTIIHGAQRGPVLGIVAGVHGYEYPPIMAAQQLQKELDPAAISGTVILVQIANVPAFLGRSIYKNPIDGKNLNRSFPGSNTGTLTDRMAWTLTQEVIARCNYFADVHAGDGNEDLRPYAGYYEYKGHDSLTEKSRQMAHALGIDFIIPIAYDPAPNEASVYGTREATQRNIPTVAIECGKLGMVQPEELRQINTALFSLMRSLRMLPGAPLQTRNPVVIRQRTFINSEHTGIFYSNLRSNQPIKKGMLLGYYTDFFGNRLGDVTSPTDGIVIYKIGTPPVNKGETLFSIGAP